MKLVGEMSPAAAGAGTLLWAGATALLLEDSWRLGHLSVSHAMVPVLTAGTVAAATLFHGAVRELRLASAAGLLGLTLLGSTATVYGTLGRQVEGNRQEWMQTRCRPWHTTEAETGTVVTKIVSRITERYKDFFSDLRAVVQAPRRVIVSLEYVVGNHDACLDIEAAGTARIKVRDVLGMPAGSAPFPLHNYDEEHEVVWQHGHQFDPENRIRGGYLPVGDVLVVEVLARLPFLVAKRITSAEQEDRLAFLRQIAIVSPADVSAWSAWILQGVSSLGNSKAALKVFSEAAKEVHDTLDKLEAGELRGRLESPEAFHEVAKALTALRLSPAAALRRARKTQRYSAGIAAQYRERIAHHVNARTPGQPVKGFLFGHTHDPFLDVLDSSGVVLINTGAWLSAFRLAESHNRHRAADLFVPWMQRDLTVVHSEDERKLLEKKQVRRPFAEVRRTIAI